MRRFVPLSILALLVLSIFSGRQFFHAAMLKAAESGPAIRIDTVNDTSAPFSFSCQDNPLTNPVGITGSGSGIAPPGQIEQYHIQIDWGDGVAEPEVNATFNPPSGQGNFTFTFSAGPHTYTADGSKTITTYLYHSQPPGKDNQNASDASVMLTTCVRVSPAPPPTASSQPPPPPSTQSTSTQPPLPDNAPPVISNINALPIDASHEKIIWTTDEPSTSRVLYGPTGAETTWTPQNDALVTSHVVILNDLSPSTQYNYRVYSRDERGNEAGSPVHSFVTLAPSPPTIDNDQDGMDDNWENTHGLNPNDPSDATKDNDGDGIPNKEEYIIGSDPNKPDSDDDGMPDPWEIQHQLLPKENDAPDDPDNDGWNNMQEFLRGSDPHHFDAKLIGTTSCRCQWVWWWLLLLIPLAFFGGHELARQHLQKHKK